MAFTEKIKDIGREVIGQGPEVKFKNTVLEHEKNMGISHEEAEKEVFNDYLGSVRSEINHKGTVDSGSEDWRNFEASLNEVFGKDKQREFIDGAVDPSVFRNIHVGSVNLRDKTLVKGYYESKFNGNKPIDTVINDSALDAKEIHALSQRFDGRTRGNPDSLNDLVKKYPEIGADIGRILLNKRSIERHEKMFGKQERTRGYNEDLKKEFKNALYRSHVDVAKGFFQDLKSIRPMNILDVPNKVPRNAFGECTKFVYATTKALGKEGLIGAKLATKLTKSCYALLSEKLAK